MLGAGMIPLAVFGSIIVGIIFLLFTNGNRSETPYILVLNCTDDAAEEKATEKLSGLVKKYIVKSKTVSDSGVELTVEVRITDGGTKFVNELRSIPGILSATLVSYNGEYMS